MERQWFQPWLLSPSQPLRRHEGSTPKGHRPVYVESEGHGVGEGLPGSRGRGLPKNQGAVLVDNF